MSGKGKTIWELPTNASGQREITLHTTGKSKLARFGPWKNYRQTPIIPLIARKCKFPTFGLWKKFEQGEITFKISSKGEIPWELPPNPNYIANGRQIQISQLWTVENLPAPSSHNAYCSQM